MAISFVQSDDYANAASSSTIANDTALSTTTGNFIVVCVRSYSAGGVVSSVTDTAGNTYSLAVAKYGNSTGNYLNEIWYALNITGNASNVTTVNYSSAVSSRYIMVAEFSGVKTSSALLDTSSRWYSGATTSFTSDNATSTSTGDLAIGNSCGEADNDSITWTKAATYTGLTSDTTNRGIAEYKVLGAAGDYDATWTATSTPASTTLAIFGLDPIVNKTVTPAAVTLSTTQSEPEGIIFPAVLKFSSTLSVGNPLITFIDIIHPPSGTVRVGTGTIGTRFIETKYPYTKGLIAGTTYQ